jgi:hypothetical protein
MQGADEEIGVVFAGDGCDLNDKGASGSGHRGSRR